MAHRDLCPEHIVITAGGALQLIAFGFARHVPCSVSRTADEQLVPGKLQIDPSAKRWPLPASPAQWRPSAKTTISSADHLPVVTRRPAAAAASTMAAKAAAEMAAAKRAAARTAPVPAPAAVLVEVAANGTDSIVTTGAAAAGGENACCDGEGDGAEAGDDDETDAEDGDGDGEATEQAIRARGPGVRYAAPEVCSL